MDMDQLNESTEERLLAFERKFLGDSHSRHLGGIERGRGSRFSELSDQHKAHHAALVALIAAEREHQLATTAEEAAHKKLEAAIERVSETGKDL